MAKLVLVACGTTIATATVVASKVKDIMKENKIQGKAVQCKVQEVKSKVNYQKYDLIISTTKVSGEQTIDDKRVVGNDKVQILSGIPFLSGRGMDELKEGDVMEYFPACELEPHDPKYFLFRDFEGEMFEPHGLGARGRGVRL